MVLGIFHIEQFKNGLLFAKCISPPDLGHESFAVICPLTLLGSAFIQFLFVGPQLRSPRLHAGLARSYALRFASLAVTSSVEDSHLRQCACRPHKRDVPTLRRARLSN